MLNSLIGYFDINSNLRTKRAEAVGAVAGQKTISSWPQWLVLYAGVLIQPFLDAYACFAEDAFDDVTQNVSNNITLFP